MPSREYYTLPIPASSQTTERGELSVNLAELASLGGDAPVVEQLSQQPGDLRLTVQYRNPYAEEMAEEIEDLADSDGFAAVAFFSPDGSTPRDGYYSASKADVEPLQPQEPRFQKVTMTLTEAGTRRTHWLGVETTPVQVDHSFGNDTTKRVAVPATAGKRRWYNPDDHTVAPVGSALATRATEHGDVVLYDIDAGETAVGLSSSDDEGPTLLYELSYSDEGVVDPVLWDDNGHSSKLDANDVRQWQHVFTASHGYEGDPILDSGLLRVYVDEAVGELTAEEWNDANSTWDAVTVDWSTTDWALFDWDVDHVSPVSIRSQATFEHPTEDLYALDAALDRGATAVRWDNPRPDEQGAIPSGLASVLDPIASSEVVDPQPVRDLVKRENTRR